MAESAGAQVVERIDLGQLDLTSYLEEMPMRPALQQRLRDCWRSDFVELAEGVNTLTRELIDAVDDDTLRSWGLRRKEIAEIRESCLRAMDRETAW